MENFDSKLIALRAGFERACALALAAVLLALLASAYGAAQVRPAARPIQQQQQQTGASRDSSSDEDRDADDDSESEPKEAARPRVTDPGMILRRARFVYVSSESAFVNAREIEDSLRKRKEFQAWGMIVTRNPAEADLLIEVTRKAFTRRFTFTVVDPRTMEVVTSGKMRSVLFGKKIPNKVAEKFANRVKVYRPYPPNS
jgi:hypothetical protein